VGEFFGYYRPDGRESQKSDPFLKGFKGPLPLGMEITSKLTGKPPKTRAEAVAS